ncbi:MFS transporter [Nocardia goodfellowii]|uniref:EmrB/QacA subfamily drug resistance transporter n=1 Tax=Nocardia goodfellowii TaxID=882446 RepID=A0ABS4QHK6_9NOCA|nr:MFS transporter [Nocardia goodfellowii]MBP2191053.1 EmrB/QacA subfamily drug resistance transporter [Nocardia goodfellowii]
MRTTRTIRSGLSAAQRRLIVLSCLAVTLVIASMAALYTALPEVAAATGASQRQLTWIVDGYTLTLACLVLPAGALGDRFGRRKMLIGGLIAFSIASAVPLILDDPVWLIAARAAAGAGAALVMPSTLSLLTAGFPADRRGAAVGLWAGIAGAGAVLGIIGSGLLLAQWSWVSIFVAMTVAGLVLSLAAFTVPESLDQERPPLDPLGGLTAALAVGMVVVAAIEAPERGWLDPLVLGLFGGGLIAAAIFTLIELRVAKPMLDVRLFADRGFGSGTASITIQFLISFGTFMVLVQFLQLILGYSPLMSAVAIAPMVVPMVALSAVAPWLADRIGLRWTTLTGLTVLGAAMLVMSRLDIDAGYLDALWPLLIMSAGLGLCSAPATTAIIAGTPPEKHGVAAAVNDAAREVGAAVGIAIMGSLLAAGYSDRITPALPRLPEAAREPVRDSLAAALQVAERAGPQAQPLADFAKDAFMHGVQQAALVVGCLTLIAALLISVWAPGRRPAPGPEPATDPEPVTAGKPTSS